MDYVIKNVARKKGIRTGVVLAGYDLDRNEPTAIASSDFTPAALEALTQRVESAEALIVVLQNLLHGYTGSFQSHGHEHVTVDNGIIKSVS